MNESDLQSPVCSMILGAGVGGLFGSHTPMVLAASAADSLD